MNQVVKGIYNYVAPNKFIEKTHYKYTIMICSNL
jgi:hypothetical protein